MNMLTRKQFDLLVFLTQQEKACSQRRMADELKMSVGTINKVVKGLTDEGLVCDGSITTKGYTALEPYRVKRAILMAAGFGSRMVPITLNTPKPLVRIKGVRIIDTLLDALLAADITEIYVVRGYLAEQFDQLLYKYPMIKFVENPLYNEANNIVSVMCCGPLIRNSYIMEADLFMRNPKLIQKYQYSSNYLAIPVERTDDYCLYTENGIIKGTGLGGLNCHQTVGISYWTDSDGARLVDHIKEVYHSPGGKEQFWGSVPLRFHAKDYTVGIRECTVKDIIEIDSFKELKALDPVYNVT